MSTELRINNLADLFERSEHTIRLWFSQHNLGDYGEKVKASKNVEWIFTVDGLKQFMIDDAANWLPKTDWDKFWQKLQDVK